MTFSSSNIVKKQQSSWKVGQLFFCFISFLVVLSLLCFWFRHYHHNTASLLYTPQATLHCIPAVSCKRPLIVTRFIHLFKSNTNFISIFQFNFNKKVGCHLHLFLKYILKRILTSGSTLCNFCSSGPLTLESLWSSDKAPHSLEVGRLWKR